MSRNTKQPEVLRELFEALGNDPFVIAECLARSVLTERLIAELKSKPNNKDQRLALHTDSSQPAADLVSQRQAKLLMFFQGLIRAPTTRGLRRAL